MVRNVLSFPSWFALQVFTYSRKVDKNGKKLIQQQLFRTVELGWSYETDAKDIVYVRIDRTRKIPVTVLLRALGFGTDARNY